MNGIIGRNSVRKNGLEEGRMPIASKRSLLRRHITGFLWLAGLMLAQPGVAAASEADGPGLQAHLAVYDLTLANASDRSGIISAAGRMVVDLDGGPCEGWTLNFRLVVQYGLHAGGSRLLDSRSSSWEAGNGSVLRYTRQQYVDNSLQSQTLLTAKRGADGKPGSVSLRKPKVLNAKLPPDVLFPVQHQLALDRAARAGNTRFRAVIFDGGDDEAVYDAIAFIGAEVPKRDYAGSIDGSGVAALAGLRAWPVSVSYYKHDGGADETPSYQVSFILFDNGVSGDIKLDYGDFSLSGKLSHLDFHKTRPCP